MGGVVAASAHAAASGSREQLGIVRQYLAPLLTQLSSEVRALASTLDAVLADLTEIVESSKHLELDKQTKTWQYVGWGVVQVLVRPQPSQGSGLPSSTISVLGNVMPPLVQSIADAEAVGQSAESLAVEPKVEPSLQAFLNDCGPCADAVTASGRPPQ
eukprot:Amastigsp_a359692_4.p1 type:complete len:158 gc:universal Amastigsp_a359692_4:485-12(-)